MLGRRLAHILIIDNHWLPITNINRLLSTQSSHNHRDNSAYCYRCLRNFYFPDRLEKHLTKCYNRMGQKEVMPTETIKTFEDWSKMLSPPFVMYADIEALLVPPEDNSKSILQTHVPCAVGSYIVADKGLTIQSKMYHFSKVNHVLETFANISMLKCMKFISLTRLTATNHNSATILKIC